MTDALTLYVDALKTKDMTNVPFTSDVTFAGIMDQTTGRAAFLEICAGFFGMIGEVRVHRVSRDERGGLIAYEFDSPAGVIPIVDVITVQDGHIQNMQPHFNPMPLLALQGQG